MVRVLDVAEVWWKIFSVLSFGLFVSPYVCLSACLSSYLFVFRLCLSSFPHISIKTGSKCHWVVLYLSLSYIPSVFSSTHAAARGLLPCESDPHLFLPPLRLLFVAALFSLRTSDSRCLELSITSGNPSVSALTFKNADGNRSRRRRRHSGGCILVTCCAWRFPVPKIKVSEGKIGLSLPVHQSTRGQ